MFRITTVPQTQYILMRHQLVFINNFFELTVVASKGKMLDLLHKEFGLRTIQVNMARRISPLKDVVSILRMIRIFKKHRPVIIHSMTPKAGLVSMLAGFITRVPHRIHTFTGLVFPAKKGLFRQLIMITDRLICRCATTIIPEGEGVKQDLLRHKITNKPLFVLGNGSAVGINPDHYDTTHFSFNQKKNMRFRLKIPENNLVILYVGRIVREKGIKELVEAFKQLYDSNKHIRLLMIGAFESQLDPICQECISDIQNHIGIQWLGEQNDVRPYYAISNILVLPSYREGFPNVVLEAGAMELPCVVTDINGSNEIVIHDETGLVVPPRDSLALQAALKTLAGDKTLRLEMGKRARERVAKKYNRDLVWTELLTLYSDCLKDS